MESAHVIIVGGGQAGLCASRALNANGIENLILERAAIGNSWRCGRWDSFRLVTPNWQSQMPGMPHRGADPDGFMTHLEVAAMLERYARAFAPALRSGVTVQRVRPLGGGFEIESDRGSLSARVVVIAAGPYGAPRLPEVSRGLPPDLVQLHSSAYRNPDALPPGAVLVVGSGQSGWQIARELHRAGRRVHWSMGRAARLPRRFRGRDIYRWLTDLGLFGLSIAEHPGGELVRQDPKPFICDDREDGPEDPRRLAREGLVMHGRLMAAHPDRLVFAHDAAHRLRESDRVCAAMTQMISTYIAYQGLSAPSAGTIVTDHQPTFGACDLDLRAAEIGSVIWATGYQQQSTGWIENLACDQSGYPITDRGLTPTPGLAFVGLDWMFTWGSGLLYGVGDDAAHVAANIAAFIANARSWGTRPAAR